jgi:hypothetical protein
MQLNGLGSLSHLARESHVARDAVGSISRHVESIISATVDLATANAILALILASASMASTIGHFHTFPR